MRTAAVYSRHVARAVQIAMVLGANQAIHKSTSSLPSRIEASLCCANVAPQKTFTHSTLLSYTHHQLKRGQTQLDGWDNFSEREQAPTSWGAKDAASCAGACVAERNCLQYSYHNNTCRLSDTIRMGHMARDEKSDMVSGWNVDRMKKLGWSDKPGWVDSCRVAKWVRPNT